MEEQRGQDEVVERAEVAPGLVMEIIHAHEPDGRYLLYYNFDATSAASRQSVSEPESPPASAARSPGEG